MRITHFEFGALVQAAFEQAARQTSDPVVQARVAAEVIARVLNRRDRKRLAALLAA